MTRDPATPAALPADGDTFEGYRPTFADLWSHCDNERGRHDIWRRAALDKIIPPAAPSADERAQLLRIARSQARQVAIYEALMRITDRMQRSPVILDELKRMAAEEAAAQVGDDVAEPQS